MHTRRAVASAVLMAALLTGCSASGGNRPVRTVEARVVDAEPAPEPETTTTETVPETTTTTIPVPASGELLWVVPGSRDDQRKFSVIDDRILLDVTADVVPAGGFTPHTTSEPDFGTRNRVILLVDLTTGDIAETWRPDEGELGIGGTALGTDAPVAAVATPRIVPASGLESERTEHELTVRDLTDPDAGWTKTFDTEHTPVLASAEVVVTWSGEELRMSDLTAFSTETGEVLWQRNGIEGPIAVSPNGIRILTADEEGDMGTHGKAAVVDAATGAEIGTIPTAEEWAGHRDFTWITDDAFIIEETDAMRYGRVTADGLGPVHTYDGSKVLAIGGANSVIGASDGSTLFIHGRADSAWDSEEPISIQALNLTTGTPDWTIEMPEDRSIDFVSARGGRLVGIASGGGDDQTVVIDTEAGEQTDVSNRLLHYESAAVHTGRHFIWTGSEIGLLADTLDEIRVYAADRPPLGVDMAGTMVESLD